MKRSMNKFESYHADRLIEQGCAICGRPAAYHHFIHSLSGIRITIEHLFGIALCPDHHQNDEDSIHQMGSETEFCGRHGISKEDCIDEVARSLSLWVSGKVRR